MPNRKYSLDFLRKSSKIIDFINKFKKTNSQDFLRRNGALLVDVSHKDDLFRKLLEKLEYTKYTGTMLEVELLDFGDIEMSKSVRNMHLHYNRITFLGFKTKYVHCLTGPAMYVLEENGDYIGKRLYWINGIQYNESHWKRTKLKRKLSLVS